MTDRLNKSSEAGFTALFIRRPVLAFVLNTLIAVAGLAAFYGVEVRELPDVDRAVVTDPSNWSAGECRIGRKRRPWNRHSGFAPSKDAIARPQVPILAGERDLDVAGQLPACRVPAWLADVPELS